MPNNEKLGKIALELISDYPLYASTSNISYEQAIAVAKAIFGNDLVKAYNDGKDQDALMAEYFKTDREHSLDDFDKWVAEKRGE